MPRPRSRWLPAWGIGGGLGFGRLARFAAAGGLGAGMVLVATARADLRISEFMAASDSRPLAVDAQGRWRPGSGPHWTDPGFAAPGWRRGTAPLGFGGAAGLGTDVGSLLRQRTPGLYLRRSFTLTATEAANLGRLRLLVRFDDGFIAWLNGREAGRANAGPPGHFLHHDQPAYNFANPVDDPRYDPRQQPGVGGGQPMVLDLGPAHSWLRAGENVLAIQLANREPDVSARLDAALEVVPATATLDLLRDDFSTANGARLVHRREGAAVTTTVDGSPPATSWLAAAPWPVSGATGPEMTLTAALDPTAGVAAGGALRITQQQAAGPEVPATWYGPAAALPAALTGSGITSADLAAITVAFRFFATPDAGWTLRLEPEPGQPAASLSGLPAVTATAGIAAAESAVDDFADAVGGARTLDVTAQGTVSGGTNGVVRNSLTLSVGPALRDFAFRVVEETAVGAGRSPGHLRCEVTRAAAVADSFGFTLQTFQVRSWTAGAITPAQLAAAVLRVDTRLAPGVPLRVWLEPAAAGAGAAQRLDLGTLTGTGNWQRHHLDPAEGTNQEAFLAAMNARSTTLVRVAFRSESPLPVGTAWQLDGIGFVPWRTYRTSLAAATNADAFLAAVNAQTAPRFFPAWDTTGAPVAPDLAELVMDDFSITLDLDNAGTAHMLVPWGDAHWDYWPGLAEPSGGVVEPADFATPAAEPAFADWIEIENTGDSAVSLAGWSLTPRREEPRAWSFPTGTMVLAGGRLVVLASGRPAAPAGAAWMHAGFTLPEDGGYLALIDPAGGFRDGFDPGYPAQGPHQSYGRNEEGVWGYLREATPGTRNSGPWVPAETEPVTATPTGGFHAGPVTVVLQTATEGATIRYTLDGTEPSLTTGLAYTAPVVLTRINDQTGHALRARAFRDGFAPSAVTTETYLIDLHPALRSAPAIVLTGDPGATFYRPSGIMAVQGGRFVDELWVPQTASDYHMPLVHGRMLDADAPQRPYERPAYLEFFPVDGRAPLGEAVGVRIASSPYSRPRLTLTQAATASPFPPDPREKPSFNIFFRDTYGDSPVTYPFIAETPVRQFGELRLRAGKNDIQSPFIRDEFIRRLFVDMGQTGSVGSFNGLWINGVYKGYYNLCERIREPFLQNHYPGSGEWDVDAIFQFEEGDSDHFANFLVKRLLADLGSQANYEALQEVMDVTNAADYYLLMVYAAMWDWPDNNWVMARERSPRGRWRCYVWDAEGGFGLNGYKPATWNSFSEDLFSNVFWMCVQFQRLMTSPEWRLHFADRIQRHFFQGGVLTDARLTARQEATAAEVRPFLEHAGVAPETAWFTQWLSPTSGRKRTLFPQLLPGQPGYTAGHFRDPNGDGSLDDTLWPVTPAPTLSLPPGTVPAGASLSLALAAGTPPGSTIWYTINGVDPRAWGGAIAASATAYAQPLPLAASTVTVRARVRHAGTGDWSPLTEAVYRVGTVPASPDNLVVSELMYHPPPLTDAEAADGFTDADEFEYLALRAIGPSPVDLSALRFSEGIGFHFTAATRAVVDPGDHVLLARRRAAIARRYGAGAAGRVIGEFFGGLGNGGELLRLETADGTVIQSFRYGDGPPWPDAADGRGSSLRLVNPAANPDPNLPSSWTASAAAGGQPDGRALPLSYDQWGAWTFTADAWATPALADPDADPDGDGWSNRLEFLLHGAALDPARFPSIEWRPTTGPGGPNLELSVQLNPGATGWTVVPEASLSLADGSWLADFTAGPVEVRPDGARRVTWSRPLPAGTAAAYGRLRVTRSTP